MGKIITKTKTRLKGKSGVGYYETPEFALWCRLVMNHNNPVTFGNFTRSAIEAYHIDETDPQKYLYARQIGHKNYKKLQDLAAVYLEKRNVTFAVLMDALLAKMATSNSLEPWEVVMDYMGYDRPNKNKKDGNPNNNQFNFYNLKNDELRQLATDAGLDKLSEAELITTLIE